MVQFCTQYRRNTVGWPDLGESSKGPTGPFIAAIDILNNVSRCRQQMSARGRGHQKMRPRPWSSTTCSDSTLIYCYFRRCCKNIREKKTRRRLSNGGLRWWFFSARRRLLCRRCLHSEWLTTHWRLLTRGNDDCTKYLRWIDFRWQARTYLCLYVYHTVEKIQTNKNEVVKETAISRGSQIGTYDYRMCEFYIDIKSDGFWNYNIIYGSFLRVSNIRWINS